MQSLTLRSVLVMLDSPCKLLAMMASTEKGALHDPRSFLHHFAETKMRYPRRQKCIKQLDNLNTGQHNYCILQCSTQDLLNV